MNNKMTVKNNIEIFMNKINTADAIVIGGGSGLSSAPEHLQGRAMAISDDIANVLSNLRIKVQGK